jgi:acetylornithine deacetylase ArgE
MFAAPEAELMLETTRLLRDLVSLPSLNPMGRPMQGPEVFEYRVTDYLEAFFRDLGVPYERQSVAPRRDNIVAIFDPPGAKRALLFEAHQDTVPVDNMTIDPFAARIDGNRLFGRGACDVKGGMAAMLGAFARLVRERPTGAVRLLMACTVDEEHGFAGVTRLASSPFVTAAELPLAAVVAEPTELEIVNSHKGAVRWDVEVTGRSCHSSRPDRGVNAIYHMAGLLSVVERYAAELSAGHTHPTLGPATLSVGIIEGGTSVNTVAARCRVEVDRRLLPGEDAQTALADFCAYVRSHLRSDIAWECSAPWLSAPALAADLSADLVNRLAAALDAVIGTHRVVTVPYGTDAAPLAAVGVPAVVFGPGDIAQAHTADEWVALDEVERASEVLFHLARAG